MDYKIGKSGESCATCENAFVADQHVFSMILFTEDSPARSDFCSACFNGVDKDDDSVFAFWRTRRLEAGRARRQVDFATLRELFFRMLGREGDEYKKLTYLLALLLLRKRFVNLREFTSEDGTDYLIVMAKQRPDPIKLEAPELLPQDFEELRDRLRGLLDFDMEGELDDALAPRDEQAAVQTGPDKNDDDSAAAADSEQAVT